MKRREFIAGLGSAAAWPLVAPAQQPALPVIGFLNGGSANTSSTLVPFLQGLKESGFVEGQNIHIEYRWADGRYERLPTMAADLVNRRVAVIAAIGGQFPAIAAKAATATIPIVFEGGGGDPVRQGLVASLNHPGGNVTGAMNTGGIADAKAVQYLRELVPGAASLGLLLNRNNVGLLLNRNNYPSSTDAEAAARELQWESQVFEASTEDDLKTAFEAMAKRKIGAMNVVPDVFFTSRRAQIVALAAEYAVPASYALREFVIDGGLMSYGADLREPTRVAGNYVGRILKGEKPGDLPVQQATRVEFAINMKTAKSLGLRFPLSLLARADEVIE
jgi:putative tryptophan/tyrosine transport system substrate-binding protein